MSSNKLNAEREKRQRLKDDLRHYAQHCLKIRTKTGSIEPLIFNSAQEYLHDRLEAQRQSDGRVRAIILKGRQQGCSTYVEARFFHKVSHSKGVKAFILTHEDEATKNIFEMSKRYLAKLQPDMTPHIEASNAREILFDRLDSGYRVATAGKKDTGRSATFQLFHGSEVAFWPYAESHARGAMQAVPGGENTEIILESTSNGKEGLFAEMWESAVRGESGYEAIFIPWFWQNEYVSDATGFEPTPEECEYMREHGTNVKQMAWRRAKIIELKGVWNFCREYPATAEEAFNAEVPGALWNREMLDENRVRETPELVRIVVAIDPAVTSKEESDETGIVVAGVDEGGHGYVLADLSRKGSPDGWARAAIRAFESYQADRIVAEVNNGGDLVEQVLRTVDRKIPYKAVHASRGKVTRAEPIAALYEQRKVHHMGVLPRLEDQMCSFTGGKMSSSPDRVDALVWALTELMLGKKRGKRIPFSLGGVISPSEFIDC